MGDVQCHMSVWQLCNNIQLHCKEREQRCKDRKLIENGATVIV